MTGVIFDLDGTLVESIAAINDIANALMRELGLGALDRAETRSYVGRGAAKFLEQALTARDALENENWQARLDRFHALYAAAPGAANTPFPGVDAALRRLAARGVALGLCTNKPEAATRAILDAHGWTPLFSALIAGDSLPERKPHPAPLLEAARRLGRDRIVFVGDSEVDAETAAAAAVPFLLFTEGYRRRPAEELAEWRFCDFDALQARLDAMDLD